MTWTDGSRFACSTHSASSRGIARVMPLPRSGRLSVIRATRPSTSYVSVVSGTGSPYRREGEARPVGAPGTRPGPALEEDGPGVLVVDQALPDDHVVEVGGARGGVAALVDLP